MILFALSLGWFPVAAGARLDQAIMPALALGLEISAIIARLTRASMLQVIREDYIRTARAKGLSERVVMVRHALKNAFIPVATILGPMFAALVTGTFVVEQIFAIPGLGKYFITSITNRDYPGGDGHHAALCRFPGARQPGCGYHLCLPGSSHSVLIVGGVMYDRHKNAPPSA